MAMQAVGPEAASKRKVFFEAIFEGLEGFIRIGAKITTEPRMIEEFYHWPDQMGQLLGFIDRYTSTHNVYFCATLFRDTKAEKPAALKGWVAWADLDACQPSHLEEPPTFLLETSPNRFQGLWRFDEPVDAYDLEDVSRRIAYKYEQYGCDKGGWGLTKFLRVPFTYNHKYNSSMGLPPLVKIKSVSDEVWSFAELQDKLPQASGYENLDVPMPTDDDLPEESGEELMQNYKKRLQPLAFSLFTSVPEKKGWSEALWQLELFCLEAGMSMTETFVVARDSACNKYERDGRDQVMLWKEICRAQTKFDQALAIQIPAALDELLSDEDRKAVETTPTLIDDYIAWAKGVGDAAPQYHQAGAFILLSALLAGPVRLPTSFGDIMPNLWFMIMADTTLTRKSTAMDLAMDLLVEIDSDAIMATDGSIEGLMTSLQFRAARPSVFLRDEFSGLLEAMSKKDYYAGMAETLTKLYDGKFQKKILRRETIEIRDPVLILFAGGIRERILQLLQYEHVASGFLPRFIFISAESDVTRLRPLGPPTEALLEGRDELLDKLRDVHNRWTAQQIMTVKGKDIAVPPEHRARLTGEAWGLYNHFESTLMEQALKSDHPDLMTPMFDRLAKSGLKAATLLACLDMGDEIVVTEETLMKAFYYVEQWREGAIELLNNIGRTTTERQIQNVLRAIQKDQGEMVRSKLMQRYHLNARETEAILMTLEQRGAIQRLKHGRTERLVPTVIPNQNH